MMLGSVSWVVWMQVIVREAMEIVLYNNNGC